MLFRSQSVIDSLHEAIAVFSSSGTLTMSNAAYIRFWGPTDTGLTEVRMLDEMQRWQDRMAPTPVWGDLRGFVDGFVDRAEWFESILLLNGQKLSCRFTPLPFGATLIGFQIDETVSFPAKTEHVADHMSGLHEPAEPQFRHQPRLVIAASA